MRCKLINHRLREHQFSRLSRAPHQKSGVTILEVILVTPVIVTMLFAVVEFGLLYANLQYLPLASRVGAKVAAEQPGGIAATITQDTLTKVTSAVETVLSNVGITDCKVVIENSNGGEVKSPPVGGCECMTPPAAPPSSTVDGVRVTVCVELAELTLDLLSSVGFTCGAEVGRASTTLPYEGP